MMYKFLYKFFLILLLAFVSTGSVYAQSVKLDNGLSLADDRSVTLGGPDYMDEGGDLAGTDCHTSTLNEITAAFNTQGYWLLDFIVASFKNGLGGWAALLYACVVFGGIAMMAMGQPPRMYLWFILGPAIFNWLLYTSVTDGGGVGVKGVCWYVGNKKISQQRVWELAEAGMVNMPKTGVVGGAIILDEGHDSVSDSFTYNIETGPNGFAQNLPSVFLFIDEVISEPIAWIVEVSGIKSQRRNNAGNLNLEEPPEFANEVTRDQIQNAASWYLLGNTRWDELMDITNASLEGNDDLREALIRFMASECGDVIADNIDDNAYLTAGARRAGGGALPESVFLDINTLKESLNRQYVPIPPEIREIMKDAASGMTGMDYESSLAAFIDKSKLTANFGKNLPNVRKFTCTEYLYFIVQGFRWASALQYNMLVKRGTDLGIPATWVTYNFLYGWRFGVQNQPKNILLYGQANFIMNMTLAYMLRNELSTAVKPIDLTYTSSQRAENYLNANVRSVGSMSKAMEFYQWSKLVPYMQGICLYILSAAYPLACLLMLIPGWHKAIITWIGFYAWAKSWDAGFAFVGALDKNIWGMLGNSDDAAMINERIYKFRQFGYLNIDGGMTADGVDNANCELATTHALLGCITPIPSNYAATGDVDPNWGGQSYENAFKTFDQALLLANNLQHDIANGYYIYLMSALYFAVPAVTGQLLLGAKAGMASLATQGIGSVSSEAGRQAGSGYAGEISNRGYQGMSVTGQEAQAKSMRQDGLAEKALMAENKSVQESLQASEYGLIGAMVDAAGKRVGHTYGAQKDAMSGLNDIANKIPGFSGAENLGFSSRSSWGRAWGTMAGRSAFHGTSGMQGKAWGLGTFLNKSATAGASFAGRAAGSTLGTAVGLINLRNAAAIGSMGASGVIGGIGVVDANKGGQLAGVGAKYKELGQQHRAESQYAKGQAGRYQEAAQQRAAEAQWRAQRRLGNQIAGSTAAVGVLAGSFQAGPKPTHMNGMIGLGYMDNNHNQSVGYGLSGYGGLNLQGSSAFETFGTTGAISGGDWGEIAKQDADMFEGRRDTGDYNSNNNQSYPDATWGGLSTAHGSFTTPGETKQAIPELYSGALAAMQNNNAAEAQANFGVMAEAISATNGGAPITQDSVRAALQQEGIHNPDITFVNGVVDAAKEMGGQ